MKALVIGLVLGLTSLSFIQKSETTDFMKTEKLSTVVVVGSGEDYSVYYPDNNSDLTVRKLQDHFISFRLGRDSKGYETFLVFFKTKRGSLTANYNKHGKLIRTTELYKNTKLPLEVQKAIAEKYHEWTMLKNKYQFIQENGKIVKKEYTVTIKKDKQLHKLIVNSSGKFLQS